MVPELKTFLPKLNILEVLETTTGMMGIWAWMARWKAPFLSGARAGVGVYDLVPS